jgi:hypothetical protein
VWWLPDLWPIVLVRRSIDLRLLRRPGWRPDDDRRIWRPLGHSVHRVRHRFPHQPWYRRRILPPFDDGLEDFRREQSHHRDLGGVRLSDAARASPSRSRASGSGPMNGHSADRALKAKFEPNTVKNGPKQWQFLCEVLTLEKTHESVARSRNAYIVINRPSKHHVGYSMLARVTCFVVI